MRSALPLMMIAALLAGCHDTHSPDQSRDARDIAMVQKAQATRPPVVLLDPEAVSFADLDAPNVGMRFPPDVEKPEPGHGCSFTAAGAAGDAPVLAAVPKVALMKLAGRLELFAADSGTKELASGLYTNYASGAHTLQFGEGEAATRPGAHKASLTVRDTYDRMVYFSGGELRCK